MEIKKYKQKATILMKNDYWSMEMLLGLPLTLILLFNCIKNGVPKLYPQIIDLKTNIIFNFLILAIFFVQILFGWIFLDKVNSIKNKSSRWIPLIKVGLTTLIAYVAMIFVVVCAIVILNVIFPSILHNTFSKVILLIFTLLFLFFMILPVGLYQVIFYQVNFVNKKPSNQYALLLLSYKIMKSNYQQYILLIFSFINWFILGILTLGLSNIFWGYSYYKGTQLMYLNDLSIKNLGNI